MRLWLLSVIRVLEVERCPLLGRVDLNNPACHIIIVEGGEESNYGGKVVEWLELRYGLV